MSKGSSPWSVVGSILGSRKRKEKKKAEAAERLRSDSRQSANASTTHVTTQESELPKDVILDVKPELPPLEPLATEPLVTEPLAVEPPAVEPPTLEPPTLEPPAVEPPTVEPPAVKPRAANPPAVDPSASGESLEEDHLYNEAAAPTKVSPEQEHEWTDVARQTGAPPSPELSSKRGTSPHPPSTEDEVVVSPSASAEHLEQPKLPEWEERSVQADQADEIEKRDAEILTLQTGKQGLEGQLAGVRDKLIESALKAKELEGTIQGQAEKIESLKADILALEEEKAEAKRTEENMREELERGRDREKELEDEGKRQTDEVLQLEVRIEDFVKEVASIESKNEALGEEIQELAEQKASLEATVQSLETEKSEAASREGALESKLEEVQKRVQELEEDLRGHLHKMEESEEEKSMALLQFKDDHAQWSSDMEALHQKLRILETDKADLLAGLESAMTRNRELEGHIAHHHNESRAKDIQMKEVKENYTNVTTQIQSALESAIQQNEEIQGQMRRQAEERRTLEQQLQELRITQAEMTKQPNQRQLERFERQNRMLIDQIRRQSENVRRLRQAPTSPPLERTFKEDMDVMALVKKLNLEIFQTAAHMADSLNFTGARSLPAHRTRGVIERATLTMGRPMVLSLTAISNQAEPDFNPLPVQFGLQACLVRCCARIVSSWYPGHWEYGEFLATIYSRIQESGSKIASKWRSVTQAQIKQPMDNELQTSMRGFLQANLVDALIVAGWYDSQTAAQETFASFRERLAQIVRLALRLNLAVGEDWEGVVVFPNERFELEVMENAYDGEDLEDVQQVVCTTGIGLRSLGGETVIKPQVILRSTLREETGYDSFE